MHTGLEQHESFMTEFDFICGWTNPFKSTYYGKIHYKRIHL